MWRNRIVKHGEVHPDSLLANPQNWRIHPYEQQQALAEIMKDIGWLQEIIVNLRTGKEWPDGERNVETMVDGHLRVILSMRGDEQSVPVTYVDLSPEEERTALLFYDRISAMAKQDEAKVAELIAELSPDNPVIAAMIVELSEVINKSMNGKSEEEAPEEFAEVDEEIETEYRCPSCGYEWSGEPK